jgi:signal transduction histidine kinase/ActR/RegA family two-component response regulator
MSDGVVVTDNQGKLLHINEAFANMIGNIPIPIQFENWPEQIGFYKADKKARYQTSELPMIRVLRGEFDDSEEIYIKNSKLKSGIWLHAGSSLLRSDDGQVLLGAVVVFRDYTKKKLEEEALIQAKESAEAMVKSKSDFLSVMSHELRTPLNGIIGMADLLATGELSHEQKDYIETIKESSELLLSKIRDVLDFNNLESGSLLLKKDRFSLYESISTVVCKYKQSAVKKGLQFEHTISEIINDMMFVGDKERITQILDNLINNAIKFTEKGSVAVCTEFVKETKLKAEIKVTIKDNGIGIADSHKEKLFEPFSQADASFNRKFEGTGLGLAVSKRLLDLMKGKMKIQSEFGRGSQFSVSIKLRKAKETQKTKSQKQKKSSVHLTTNQALPNSQSLNIMVAEDNPVNQKLINKVLTKLGYEAFIVNNGEEATEAASSHFFDIILMDLQMPKMDGLEASRKILDNNRHKKIPKIIALTANITDGTREVCQKAGMCEYMSKPLRIDKLVQVLRKYS